MKILNAVSSESDRFSYKIPISWGSGDIHPSSLCADVKSLIDHILMNNSSGAELIELRSDDRFKELYIQFHKILEDGVGVIFLQDLLPVNNLSKDIIYNIFMSFCSFLGEPVPINKQGDLLREVKDSGLKDSVSKPVRGHLTNQSLAFHSDRSDITALLCTSQAYQGGEFKIGSSAKLFRELEKRKDLLDILSSNISHDLRDEGTGDMLVCAHPIISHENIFWVRYIRKFIESISRFDIALDQKLVEALDYTDSIVNSDGFSQELVLRPGDLIIFNNHLTLHSRNAFIDSELQKRCLLRIWLSSEFSRPLPESLKPVFHQVSAGSSRGGVR